MELAIVENDELVVEAHALIITDGDTYSRGATLFKLLSDMIKLVEADAKPHIDDARKTLDGLRKSLKEKIDPLENLKARIRLLMANYDQEQTRLAKLRQAELERVAKEKADAEALELAERLESLGLNEEAAHVIEHPEEIAPVVVQKEVPKVEGVKYVERWHYEVTNVRDMLNGWLNDIVPWQAFEPSKGFLQKQVNALKGELKYPGVRVWSDKLPQ